MAPNRVLFTVKEFAVMIGYSERSVHRLIAAGEIEAIRFGENGRFRIPARVVNQWTGMAA